MAGADHPLLGPPRQLFQEEHRKAEELLAAAAQRHQQLQQKCQQQQQKRQRCVWRPCPRNPHQEGDRYCISSLHLLSL